MKKIIFNLLTLFLKISCTEDFFDIDQVLILENNFWGENRTQTKTDKGFLTDVTIKIKNGNGSHIADSCLRKYCFYDKVKQKQCFLLNNVFSDVILSNIKEGKNLVLKTKYTYTNFKIVYEGSLGTYIRNRKYYDNYKILGEDIDGVIRFEDNMIKSYLSHIKSIFSKIFNSGFIVLENFDLVVDIYFKYQNPKFELYYFKSFSKCVKSFKNFLNYFNFQNFDDDESQFLKSHMSCLSNFNVLYLENYLRTKFNLDYKEKKEIDSNDCIKLIFERCCSELGRNLLPNHILLPFKETFTVDFYFDKFYDLIKEVIEEMIQGQDPIHDILNVDFRDLILKFKTKVINMFEEHIFDTWESLNALKYFSDLFERRIENLDDFIEIDKVMCDYYNIICFINGMRHDVKESEINFTNPMFNDEFECRLVKTFLIKFNDSNKHGELIAYDSKENKKQFIENVDYFVLNCQGNVYVMISFEKLREKAIEKIEILTKDKKFKGHFMTKKFYN